MSTTEIESNSLATLSFTFFRNMYIQCGRTLNRFIRTMTTLSRSPGTSIAAASVDSAEAKAIYRLLKNPALTEERVLTSYRTETLRQMKESGETVFLCVQDTTEISYATREKTPELGECRSPRSKGLLAHSSLVLMPTGLPLGLLHQKIWARDPKLKGQRKVSRPFEEKESYKWTEAAKASVVGLPPEIRLIHMGDREADFFEFLHTLEKDRQSYVVRALQNRITEPEGLLMWDEVRKQPVAAQVVVSIPRDTRKGLPARETTLAIRYLSVTVQVPAHLKQKRGEYRPHACTVIHAVEITPSPEREAIEWFLLTNLPITTADEAFEKVGWYVQRWKIERFHYILKSGCEVEKMQERHAERLRKLILLYSIIAIQLQHLTYLAREKPDTSCTLFMNEEEWQVLYRITHKTTVLPTHPPSLREVVFSLAKLGGFLGRKSDGDPGVKVLWKGLQTFRTILDHYHYLL